MNRWLQLFIEECTIPQRIFFLKTITWEIILDPSLIFLRHREAYKMIILQITRSKPILISKSSHHCTYWNGNLTRPIPLIIFWWKLAAVRDGNWWMRIVMMPVSTFLISFGVVISLSYLQRHRHTFSVNLPQSVLCCALPVCPLVGALHLSLLLWFISIRIYVHMAGRSLDRELWRQHTTKLFQS